MNCYSIHQLQRWLDQVLPSDISKELDAGFFRYQTKPIKINEIMTAIDEALERSKMQSTPVSLKEHP
jgi:CheY-like chemotaxis protein